MWGVFADEYGGSRGRFLVGLAVWFVKVRVCLLGAREGMVGASFEEGPDGKKIEGFKIYGGLRILVGVALRG